MATVLNWTGGFRVGGNWEPGTGRGRKAELAVEPGSARRKIWTVPGPEGGHICPTLRLVLPEKGQLDPLYYVKAPEESGVFAVLRNL
jgi:hypothetical protein